MAAVTICNLSEEAHRALKVRAAQHNRSAESEMRAILEAPEDRAHQCRCRGARTRPRHPTRRAGALRMILLGTNVVSDAMKLEPHPSVRDWPDAQAAETLFLCSVTIAELLFGIGTLPDGRRKHNLRPAGILQKPRKVAPA